MKRIGHDLPGAAQRIAKLSQDLSASAAETQQMWRDAKGQAFFQQHISQVSPIISQLVSALSRNIELFENIARQVQDSEND